MAVSRRFMKVFVAYALPGSSHVEHESSAAGYDAIILGGAISQIDGA
jgi:hypothetical protein